MQTIFQETGLTIANITRQTIAQADSGVLTITDGASNTFNIVVPWATAQSLSVSDTFSVTITTP